MRLANAAKYFDRLTVYDGYSGMSSFKAQFDLFDDARRDAVGILRRVLSVANTVTVPARLVVECPIGKRWVVGAEQHLDTFGDAVIRKKYVVQSADNLIYLRTPGQVISGVGGTAVYGGFAWMKDWKEAEFGSKTHPYYEIFVSIAETVLPGTYLVNDDGRVFRARSTYTSEAGFLVVESDELEGAVKALTVTGPGTFNPTLDTVTGSPIAGYGLVMRFSANFEYLQESAIKRQEGDVIALVPKSSFATVKTNDKVLIGAESYVVLAVVSDQDCWRLHLRP